jgi:hypothetical protein
MEWDRAGEVATHDAPHLGVRIARSGWQCGVRGVGDGQVASLLVLPPTESRVIRVVGK